MMWLLGASVSVIAVIFGWNRADTETFAQLAASSSVSAAVAVNPLLALVAVVALARAYDKARRGGEYGEMLDGSARGVVGSAAVLASVAAVGAAGGSAGLVLLSGLVAGVVVHRATRDVSLVTVSRFVAARAAAMVAEVGALPAAAAAMAAVR